MNCKQDQHSDKELTVPIRCIHGGNKVHCVVSCVGTAFDFFADLNPIVNSDLLSLTQPLPWGRFCQCSRRSPRDDLKAVRT